MRPRHFLSFAALGLAVSAAAELQPQSLGKGSYAPGPPEADAKLREFLNGRNRLDPSLPAGTAIPSNDTFSFALWSTDRERNEFGRTYAMPLAVSVDASGIGIARPTSAEHPLRDLKNSLTVAIFEPGHPEAPASFPAGCQKVLRIGDWSMTYRLHVSAGKFVDLTLVRGMPTVWMEAEGLELAVRVSDARISGMDGHPLGAGGATGAVLENNGLPFGIYTDDAGRLSADAAGLRLASRPGRAVLAIAALPDAGDAPEWRKAALAIPRGTDFSWRYDRPAGRIVTTWKIQTEKLGEGAGRPIQGWLPHQWRQAMDREVKFLAGEFPSPRGKIKLARGEEFTLSWPVIGVVPAMPAPGGGGSPPFDKARLEQMLALFATENTGANLKYGDDTYFGGKDVLRYAQTAAVASQIDSPAAPALQAASRAVLADWFTWTPGEKARYWARYETLGAFVGFKPSFNSQEFRDTHFHGGYFTYAAAIQCAIDKTFAAEFGGIATLVAKQYANWDKTDKRFPFLRTFDPWEGHSFASSKGNAAGDSANQESSSEAMVSWAGVALLGAALGDDKMLECGLMGYAIEFEAVREYWNDYHGWKASRENPARPGEGNWPASYKNSIVGIVAQGGNRFGTFFSGAPYHIYGIQWLPLSPALQYLGWNREFAKFQWDQMIALQRRQAKTPDFDIENLSKDDLLRWSNVMIGYLALTDPDGIGKRWDAMADAGHPATRDKGAALTYYLIHAYQSAGVLDVSAWTDQPTASVMRRADGGRNIVAWNPGKNPLTVTAHDARGILGRTTIPAGGIVRSALPAPK